MDEDKPQEERKLPRLSTISVDLQAYSDQRKLFLEAYISFRQGYFDSGDKTLNYLISMYYILPATRHISINEKEASEFIASIEAMRAELRHYFETNSSRQNFSSRTVITPEIYAKVDKIVRNFHKIMFECGYSR